MTEYHTCSPSAPFDTPTFSNQAKQRLSKVLSEPLTSKQIGSLKRSKGKYMDMYDKELMVSLYNTFNRADRKEFEFIISQLLSPDSTYATLTDKELSRLSSKINLVNFINSYSSSNESLRVVIKNAS